MFKGTVALRTLTKTAKLTKYSRQNKFHKGEVLTLREEDTVNPANSNSNGKPNLFELQCRKYLDGDWELVWIIERIE